MSEEAACKNGHVIDKVTPAITDLYFANRVCDCGKLFWYLEKCSCPAAVTPTYELRSKPNPDYNGQ